MRTTILAALAAFSFVTVASAQQPGRVAAGPTPMLQQGSYFAEQRCDTRSDLNAAQAAKRKGSGVKLEVTSMAANGTSGSGHAYVGCWGDIFYSDFNAQWNASIKVSGGVATISIWRGNVSATMQGTIQSDGSVVVGQATLTNPNDARYPAQSTNGLKFSRR